MIQKNPILFIIFFCNGGQCALAMNSDDFTWSMVVQKGLPKSKSVLSYSHELPKQRVLFGMIPQNEKRLTLKKSAENVSSSSDKASHIENELKVHATQSGHAVCAVVHDDGVGSEISPEKNFSNSLKRTVWKASVNGSIPQLVRELKKDRLLANVVTNSSNVRPLQWAASSGQIRTVEILLHYGARVNECDTHGRNALSFASSNNDLPIVKKLCEHGAQVFMQDNEGKTPLHWGVASKKIVEFLVEKDERLVTVVDHEGKDPLQRAAGGGYRDTVLFLLRKNVPVDRRDKQGRTALWWAAAEGHVKICALLIEAGSDINTQDNEGQSILAWAGHKNREEVVELLVGKKVRCDLVDQLGKTALHWAVQYPTLVRRLIPYCDVNAVDVTGATPLSWAAHYGVDDSVTLLLQAGAVPDLADQKGSTPLSLASAAGHHRVVNALSAYYPVKETDLIGSLNRAAYVGNVSVLEALVSRGAQVNVADSEGRTALSWAASGAQEKAVAYLISQGALVNKPDQKNQTPLSWAVYQDAPGVVALLLAAGAQAQVHDILGKTPLHWATSIAVAGKLIEAGADIHAVDLQGNTCFFWVCYAGNYDLATYLMSKGSRIEDRNAERQTPLRWAVEYPPLVELLLGAKADPSSESSDGLSIVHVASYMRKTQSVIALLNAGADETKCDTKGRNALHIAAQRGSFPLVQLFLQRKRIPVDLESVERKRTAVKWALRMHRLAIKKSDEQNPISLTAAILVELVLSGADTTAKGGDGETPNSALFKVKKSVERDLLERALCYAALSSKEQKTFRNSWKDLYESELQEAKKIKDVRTIDLLSQMSSSCLFDD